MLPSLLIPTLRIQVIVTLLTSRAHPDVDVLTDETDVATVVIHQQVEDVVSVSCNGPEMVNI